MDTGVPGSLVGDVFRVVDERSSVPRFLFSLPSRAEISRVSEVLRRETVGGLLLLIAAVIAMAWANSPGADSYRWLQELDVAGLSLQQWAADALLAVFFFVVGVELKQEFLVGDLRDPAKAVLPVLAAVAGMVVPALLYLTVVGVAGSSAVHGWAVPTSTDIAFAVAVLAVVGTHLPSALRTFLLTLAVVDDLLGITVIAVFYTSHLHLWWLLAACVPIALAAFAMRRGWYWSLIVLAPAAWLAVHHGGVHPTIAGVLLGFAVPLSGAPWVDRRVRPVSAVLCVPIFALLVAGTPLGGLGDPLKDPIPVAIAVALVVGKPLGICLSTWLLVKFTRASLDPSVDWPDIVGVGLLAGIGFTVSLLIAGLAFGGAEFAQARAGVIAGSVLSAVLAAVLLRIRNIRYRWAMQQEELHLGCTCECDQ